MTGLASMRGQCLRRSELREGVEVQSVSLAGDFSGTFAAESAADNERFSSSRMRLFHFLSFCCSCAGYLIYIEEVICYEWETCVGSQFAPRVLAFYYTPERPAIIGRHTEVFFYSLSPATEYGFADQGGRERAVTK